LDLNVIPVLKGIYPDLKIGYSGHEIGYKETLIAVAAGAEIIERHFTLDNNMEGTDQKASLNPVDFKNMVEEIKHITKVLGNDYMTVYPAEEIVKAKMRK
jgi:sialic acid synthase SpsE